MSGIMAVQLDDVSKMYPIYKNPKDRLKQSLWLGKHKFYHEFWALKHMTLSIPQGQTVGIVGRNGSGKSTLLQILAGTLTPTGGQVRVEGKVAAILELGSGFNPELNGRENAAMHGAIMGLSQREIAAAMPRIEQFAEIGDFIDQPVKTYSSGMFVRLAFACAVNVNPDILIVDEALAVGDMKFQLKCINKMKAFKKSGKTIIYVSHDTYSVRNFCDTCIWLMDGSIHMSGDVQTVTDKYDDFMKRTAETDEGNDIKEQDKSKPEPPHDQLVRIDKITFVDENGIAKQDFDFSEPLTAAVDYTVYGNIPGLVGGVAIFDKQNNYVCGLNTKLDHYQIPDTPGQYTLKVHYQDIKLLPGTYYIDVAFFESSAIVLLDHKSRYDYFRIHADGEYFAEGITYIPHRWEAN